MPETSDAAIVTSVEEPLERLLAFEPTTLPVVSLYLDTSAGNGARPDYTAFVRRELASRAKTYRTGTPERESFDRDMARIERYLEDDIESSANGVAVFACSGAGLWEAVQLQAAPGDHFVYVYHQPHLYHLARLDDEYPRYAALVTDAHHARIFLFGLGETIETEQVKGKKMQRVKVGGWSQARYQRRVENAQASHAKEVIDALGRLVRQEQVRGIVLAGDPQTTALLREEMPKELAEKVVDAVRMNVKASEQEVFEATLEAMREKDAETDAEKIERLLDQYRAGGLACIGPEATLEALANGQVDELLLCTCSESLHPEEKAIEAILAPEIPDAQGSTESDSDRKALLSDLLVTKAKQTDATVSFIQDAALMTGMNGVGAFLRWRA
ncbi:MAG: Vms1/Ankzf1 family peptidyl-tRNA hydrolase [Bryobacteraceae bacterium]|nr:Vms1/Ankzf1 family peptidyl-tRNA hydrolase [Bryobacteraceae bacterium]